MQLKTAFKMVVGLNLVQALARIIFAALGLSGGMGQFMQVPVSGLESSILAVGFLALGIAGMVSVLTVVSKKGYAIGTIATVSMATIVFDIYGLTFQPSAVIGFVVPLMSIGYIVLARRGTMVISSPSMGN
jgi:hypothetical protein